jgi:hypothetical protein
LENGEVVEIGNHRELIEMNGKYAELFNTQAKRYIDNSFPPFSDEMPEDGRNPGRHRKPEGIPIDNSVN